MNAEVQPEIDWVDWGGASRRRLSGGGDHLAGEGLGADQREARVE